jgi:hypothetical protein
VSEELVPMGKGEDREGERGREGVTRTGGEDAAKGYAAGEVANGPLAPTMEMETIRIEDPRWLPAQGATGREEKRGSGPRNPEQRFLKEKAEGALDFPEDLPATKRQPIVIDSDLLMDLHEAWQRSKAAEKKEGAEEGGQKTEEGTREEATTATAMVRAAAGPGAMVAPAPPRPGVESARQVRTSRRGLVIAIALATVAGGALALLSRGGGREAAEAPSAAPRPQEGGDATAMESRMPPHELAGGARSAADLPIGAAASASASAGAVPHVPPAAVPQATQVPSAAAPPKGSAAARPEVRGTAKPAGATAPPPAEGTAPPPSGALPVERPPPPPDPYDRPNYD